MDNAFVTWAKGYIAHIEDRLPWLESRRITMGETRDGVRVDTTQDMVEELMRQREELLGLISQHEARNA